MALSSSSEHPDSAQQRMDYLRSIDFNFSTILNTSNPTNSTTSISIEGADESVKTAIEEKLHVAVGDDVKEGNVILMWALQNFSGRKICVLHIHVPAQMIPFLGGKFPASTIQPAELRAFRELEKQNMEKIHSEYIYTCRKYGVRAEILNIESDNIENGIVELISQYGIKKLVMGAAARKHYSRKMIDLRSRKAIFVNQEAPVTCHILFVCKGSLIFQREAKIEEVNNSEDMPQFEEQSKNSEIGQMSLSRARSKSKGPSTSQNLVIPNQDSQRGLSPEDIEVHSPRGARGVPNSPLYWDSASSSNLSQSSHISNGSSIDIPNSSVTMVHSTRGEGSEHSRIEIAALPQPKEEVPKILYPSVVAMEGRDDELYQQLEEAMEEARNAKREAFEESLRRGKAEKDAMAAMRRAKVAETNYAEELKQRKDIEVIVMRERQELEKIHNQRDEVVHELRTALTQKATMEAQVAESDELVKTLEEKIMSAVELLKSYKKERDELQSELDNALKLAEELKQKQTEKPSLVITTEFISEFTLAEIEEATRGFHPSTKIGEKEYGSIYKGLLRNTEVTIKTMHPQSNQGPLEFQQEVDVLSKLRHPNLITLIGTCPETWTLIYEFAPNGNLEDRLNCTDNTSPLPWQNRIRIAAELCSVLVFLHSSKPYAIVHGDLKPCNILLDGNFVSKLSEFGICRIMSEEKKSSYKTISYKTGQKGTFAYIDPEFLATGELTIKSDVYSFGIIILQLLTGKSAFGIVKEVKNAVENGTFKDVLDSSAGDWPYVQAQQLASIGLRCAEMTRKNRPDLGSEVWRVLDPMRASCGKSSSSSRVGSEEICPAPSYFLCPIFQEVMQDPHVASDGFTYEAEALKGWLESGHDTSPMTNLKLENTTLVPNLALRSAVQEWLAHQ